MSVHEDCMEFGQDQGWWPSYDKIGPHPWPIFYIVKSKLLRRPTSWNGVTMDYTSEPFEPRSLEHLLSHIGAFNSISESRRSGFAGMVNVSEIWIRKNKPNSVHLWIDED